MSRFSFYGDAFASQRLDLPKTVGVRLLNYKRDRRRLTSFCFMSVAVVFASHYQAKDVKNGFAGSPPACRAAMQGFGSNMLDVGQLDSFCEASFVPRDLTFDQCTETSYECLLANADLHTSFWVLTQSTDDSPHSLSSTPAHQRTTHARNTIATDHRATDQKAISRAKEITHISEALADEFPSSRQLFLFPYENQILHTNSCYIMVLSPQAVRNWKLATYVCTGFAAVHAVFYTEYSMPPHLKGQKHVFSDLQSGYRRWIDQHIWGLPPPAKQRRNNVSASTKESENQSRNEAS